MALYLELGKTESSAHKNHRCIHDDKHIDDGISKYFGKYAISYLAIQIKNYT